MNTEELAKSIHASFSAIEASTDQLNSVQSFISTLLRLYVDEYIGVKLVAYYVLSVSQYLENNSYFKEISSMAAKIEVPGDIKEHDLVKIKTDFINKLKDFSGPHTY